MNLKYTFIASKCRFIVNVQKANILLNISYGEKYIDRLIGNSLLNQPMFLE